MLEVTLPQMDTSRRMTGHKILELRHLKI